MASGGTWGTDIEIFNACSLLYLHIFLFIPKLDNVLSGKNFLLQC